MSFKFKLTWFKNETRLRFKIVFISNIPSIAAPEDVSSVCWVFMSFFVNGKLRNFGKRQILISAATICIVGSLDIQRIAFVLCNQMKNAFLDFSLRKINHIYQRCILILLYLIFKYTTISAWKMTFLFNLRILLTSFWWYSFTAGWLRVPAFASTTRFWTQFSYIVKVTVVKFNFWADIWVVIFTNSAFFPK